MERPTFRIKVKLDASDAGRWFLVQEKWSWADFRSSLSAKLGRTVAKVCDQDGGEFDDVSLLRENDIVLVTEAQNANSLSTPLSAHTPTPAALEKVRNCVLMLFEPSTFFFENVAADFDIVSDNAKISRLSLRQQRRYLYLYMFLREKNRLLPRCPLPRGAQLYTSLLTGPYPRPLPL
jgi:hypothetical protein